MYQCSNCHKPMSVPHDVCPHCGALLSGVKCLSCQYVGTKAEFIANDNRCPHCNVVAVHLAGMATPRPKPVPRAPRPPRVGKSPGAHLFASLLIPGLGTMLCGKAKRGWFILGLSAFFFIGVTLLIDALIPKNPPPIGALLAIPVWIWGMVDGYQSAVQWNREHPPPAGVAGSGPAGTPSPANVPAQEYPPPPPPPTPPPSNGPVLSVELERLAVLHHDGALTDDEFQAAKSRLIEPQPVDVPMGSPSGATEDESGSVPESPVERVHPAVEEKPSAEIFLSLAGDDRQARRQAIAVLLSTGYQDPEDTRTFAILGRSPGVEYSQDELNEDVEKYPDFDIAYVRAAYPIRSEDHAHADISLFPDGLVRCTVKARLLARLCSYCTWKHEWLKALDLAVAAVLIGIPSEGPGDMVQVLSFFSAAFDQVGLRNDADLATKVKAPYNLGPEETAAVERAVTALVSQNTDDVRWAADTVREKLLRTAQEQR